MRLLPGLLVAAGLLGAYLATATATAAAKNGAAPARLQDRKRVEGQRRVPVLVELFTSEGCSSCPPADAELAELVRDQPVAGAEVIPLALHVDYWNNLGWKDPFSAAQFSARQNDYGRAFRLDSVYTPQMVVDGRTEFNGSDDARAAQAIRNAATTPRATVTLTATPKAATVRVSGAPRVAPGDHADVYVAVTEDGLRSSVAAGENAGRRLAHVAVVRSLRKIGRLGADGSFAGSVDLILDKSWRRGELSAVAFVQEAGSRRVLGVGTGDDRGSLTGAPRVQADARAAVTRAPTRFRTRVTGTNHPCTRGTPTYGLPCSCLATPNPDPIHSPPSPYPTALGRERVGSGFGEDAVSQAVRTRRGASSTPVHLLTLSLPNGVG